MASPPPQDPDASPTQSRPLLENVKRRASNVAAAGEDFMLRHDVPPGFMAASAEVGVKAPSIGDLRRRRTGSGSGSELKAGPRKGSGVERQGTLEVKGREGVLGGFGTVTEEPGEMGGVQQGEEAVESRAEEGEGSCGKSQREGEAMEMGAYSVQATKSRDTAAGSSAHDAALENYDSTPSEKPASRSCEAATAAAFRTTFRWLRSPFNFLLALYGLNVVAWGGMLFLLMCNASPAMCWAPIPDDENQLRVSPAAALALSGPYRFDCNEINSPRRVWIEIDSQILNALFCVTGLGLVPWRARDLWFLVQWRVARNGRAGNKYGLRVLAGIHRGWFRLEGNETLRAREGGGKGEGVAEVVADAEGGNDERVPIPASKTPPLPLTGVRAPGTKLWKLDFFIWCQVWNTFFQCCLCGFMWGMDRYDRPSWSTGLFVALACGVAAIGGLVSFLEGKKVKKVEGEPVKELADGSRKQPKRAGTEALVGESGWRAPRAFDQST